MYQALYWALNINLSKCMVLTKNSSFVNIFIYVYFINFLFKNPKTRCYPFMDEQISFQFNLHTIIVPLFIYFANIKYFLTINFEFFLFILFYFRIPFGIS